MIKVGANAFKKKPNLKSEDTCGSTPCENEGEKGRWGQIQQVWLTLLLEAYFLQTESSCQI